MKTKLLIFLVILIAGCEFSYSQISANPTPALRAFGYYIDTINGSFPCKFFLNYVSNITQLGPSEITYYVRGGTWFNGKFYCTATSSNQNYIFYVDTSTGARQNFTLISGFPGRIEGITWCPNDTPYIYFTYLYNSINNLAKYWVSFQAYNTLTAINHTSVLRNLAASNESILYSIDETGMLGTINRTNGTWTNVGQTGITIDNYDGLEFDRTTNTLYCMAQGSLYTVNTSNGSSTLVGNFANNARINALAIVFSLPLEIKQIGNTIPAEFSLSQNYPNPFNPVTKIKYQLAKSSDVILVVYDILGREVTTLVNEKQDAGYYQVECNAINFASGVYFYKLTAGDFSETKKMVLLK